MLIMAAATPLAADSTYYPSIIWASLCPVLQRQPVCRSQARSIHNDRRPLPSALAPSPETWGLMVAPYTRAQLPKINKSLAKKLLHLDAKKKEHATRGEDGEEQAPAVEVRPMPVILPPRPSSPAHPPPSSPAHPPPPPQPTLPSPGHPLSLLPSPTASIPLQCLPSSFLLPSPFLFPKLRISVHCFSSGFPNVCVCAG